MTRRTRAQVRAEEIAELENAEANRRHLERAQTRATARQLLAAKRRIGVSLADACGAETAEELEALANVVRDRAFVEVISERAGLRRHAVAAVRRRTQTEHVVGDSDGPWAWLVLSQGVGEETEAGVDHA